MLTSDARRETIARSLNAGTAGFIVKPLHARRASPSSRHSCVEARHFPANQTARGFSAAGRRLARAMLEPANTTQPMSVTKFSRPAPSIPARWFWLYALFALVIAALAAVAIAASFAQQRRGEALRIEAIANLRLEEIGFWFNDRKSEAKFAATSREMAGLFLRWRDDADLPSRDRMLGRLIDFREVNDLHSVLVVDEQGDVIAAEPGVALETPAELKAAA